MNVLPRFFHPGAFEIGQELELDDETAKHIARVLRMQEGESIQVFNGKGALATAVLSRIGKFEAKARVDAVDSRECPWRVTIAFSVGKPPAVEFVLRRATEIGVKAFQPLSTEHSQPGELRLDRLEKIIQEVCKQCQELHMPVLHPVRSSSDWLKAWGENPVLFCDETDRTLSDLKLPATGDVAVVIGPEGGWSPEEIRQWTDSGAIKKGLGRNRLRMETAAVVSAVLAKTRLGEFEN